MTEQQYIIVTNRVHISSALKSLMECLPGEDYGIDKDVFFSLTKPLAEIQTKLFDLTEIEDED